MTSPSSASMAYHVTATILVGPKTIKTNLKGICYPHFTSVDDIVTVYQFGSSFNIYKIKMK
jgi:hypothetical protein